MVSIVAWLPVFSESAMAPYLRVKVAFGALERGDPPIWDQHSVPKCQ